MPDFRLLWKGFGLIHRGIHSEEWWRLVGPGGGPENQGLWISYRWKWGFGLRHGITTRRIG